MFDFDILEIDQSLEIINKGVKTFYNTDNITSASNWVRMEVIKEKTYDSPQLSSPLNVKQKGRGMITKDAIGYFHNSNNNTRTNATQVGIYSSCISTANGLSINKSNFYKVMCLFTARKTIEGNWLNWYDEYLEPNEEHELFEQFKQDSIVYSLFESKSNQSSLRQILYKEQIWDIKNNFFWMSKEEMTNLANNGNYPELYNDARTDSDRYVYNLLFGEQRIYDQLSYEAKDVLDSASNLVRLSFGMRRNFADDTNHLNSWDAGYAQLKLLWKEYYPEQFKEFRDKYKVLEDKMKPMVYELGFLLK